MDSFQSLFEIVFNFIFGALLPPLVRLHQIITTQDWLAGDTLVTNKTFSKMIRRIDCSTSSGKTINCARTIKGWQWHHRTLQLHSKPISRKLHQRLFSIEKALIELCNGFACASAALIMQKSQKPAVDLTKRSSQLSLPSSSHSPTWLNDLVRHVV